MTVKRLGVEVEEMSRLMKEEEVRERRKDRRKEALLASSCVSCYSPS